MGQLKTYDFGQVGVSVGGRIVGGFADGECVKVERNEDSFSLKVGGAGDATRVASNNKSGKITLRLLQSSESNAILSGFAAADELGKRALVPVLIRDASGSDIHAAEQAWIVKQPAAGYSGDDDSVREWVLETDNLVMFLGGN